MCARRVSEITACARLVLSLLVESAFTKGSASVVEETPALDACMAREQWRPALLMRKQLGESAQLCVPWQPSRGNTLEWYYLFESSAPAEKDVPQCAPGGTAARKTETAPLPRQWPSGANTSARPASVCKYFRPLVNVSGLATRTHTFSMSEQTCLYVTDLGRDDSGVYVALARKASTATLLLITRVLVRARVPMVRVRTQVLLAAYGRCVIEVACEARELSAGASLFLGDRVSGSSAITSWEYYRNTTARVLTHQEAVSTLSQALSVSMQLHWSSNAFPKRDGLYTCVVSFGGQAVSASARVDSECARALEGAPKLEERKDQDQDGGDGVHKLEPCKSKCPPCPTRLPCKGCDGLPYALVAIVFLTTLLLIAGGIVITLCLWGREGGTSCAANTDADTVTLDYGPLEFEKPSKSSSRARRALLAGEGALGLCGEEEEPASQDLDAVTTVHDF
ncbi:TPA_asm: MC157R [Molluscum contagiosum virus]|uniref:MC157R n=1 Tax=Molluscum contagiosum virus subtype 1 TaxID=10280 RepID=A0A7G5AXF9_MCV1|nr:MC157 [Molluscum contagiosum virus subtype 1]DBA37418.1 TPA_asm: MC157R [Molluscum contagiosum virus]QMV28660.1 MC157R [Molluscum contagiosum virus subtype 1]DBA37598.1 TPA_asm: MC157R [Molluscum contagiosum virus]DBA37778.1 TPA_asm: MC157R [Molluscum contagiosum virus]